MASTSFKAAVCSRPTPPARQLAPLVPAVPRLPGCVLLRRSSVVITAQAQLTEAPAPQVQQPPAVVMPQATLSDVEIDDAVMEARRQQRQREQLTYQASAIAITALVAFLAICATYARFDWHLREGGDFPWLEMLSTLALVGGGMFGMEMYARFAHKVLWHDYEPGWALHKSHHEPRVGPFEANDIYAVANGVPAFALCMYGFLTPTVVGGMCFGAGLGITLFGIAYMFVHDGLVHRRFPVGPIAEHPFVKRLVAAHQLHHAEKYEGAPWGMFLALDELDKIPGAREEVERMVRELDYKKAKALAPDSH